MVELRVEEKLQVFQIPRQLLFEVSKVYKNAFSDS
jgi:hypothetical protein